MVFATFSNIMEEQKRLRMVDQWNRWNKDQRIISKFGYGGMEHPSISFITMDIETGGIKVAVLAQSDVDRVKKEIQDAVGDDYEISVVAGGAIHFC